MTKHVRFTSLVLALVLAISCVTPAFAAGSMFTYTHDGVTSELSYQVFDKDGNPVPTTYAAGGVLLGPGEELLLGDYPSSNQIYLVPGQKAIARVLLKQAAPLEIGYRIDMGSYHFLERFGSGTDHKTALYCEESGNYYFAIRNISNVTITITKVFVTK